MCIITIYLYMSRFSMLQDFIQGEKCIKEGKRYG